MWLMVLMSCGSSEAPPEAPVEEFVAPEPVEEIAPAAPAYLALRELADQAVDEADGLQAGLAFVDRFLLSGDVNDLVEALGRFEEGGGGGAARIEALLELHDVAAAEQALRAEGSAAQKARAQMLRGKYADATTTLETAPAGLATSRTRAALLRATGDYAKADVVLSEAVLLPGLPPALKATVLAEQAELDLDRGAGAAALKDIDAIDGVMTGWWRADELRARALMLQGDPDAALAVLEPWANAGERPELMDVAAQATLAAGLPAKASTWAASALGDHNRRFEISASAAASPLIWHWLVFEDGEPDQVVGLAEEQARILGDVRTLTLLAHARLVTGDTAGAVQAVEKSLASGASTPSLHAVAAEAYRGAGDTAKASEHEGKLAGF